MAFAPRRGTVYLVGAGPGDPGLVTVRGASLLAHADAVLHDLLVDERILGLCRPGAEVVSVGRRAGSPPPDLGATVGRAASLARAGKVVVRLKGGDPFVFGRGGEEAELLRAAGVPYEIVPGITSGVAAPAYAGIPVTHRGLAHSVAFVTVHEEGAGEPDWARLAAASTLVLYMGVRTLEPAARALIAAGRPGSTPVAVIERGTRPTQRVVSGTLADIAARAAAASLVSPAVTVVGAVAALREKLAWYEGGPLFGRRVVVVRAGGTTTLSDTLEQAGAEPVEIQAAEVEPPGDPAPFDAALRGLGRYDVVLFQSALAVERVVARLLELGLDARALAGVRLVAVGPATAAALESRGLAPDVGRAQGWRAAEVLEAISGGTPLLVSPRSRRLRVLAPRGEVDVRAGLVRGLVAAGAEVAAVEAYRLAPAGAAREAALAALPGAAAVAFPSSSAARHFCALIGPEPGARLSKVAVAAMGAETARTLDDLGVRVDVVPSRSSAEELVAALAARLGPAEHGG